MQTRKPVILFPIAFHMNRSPITWNSPRVMNKFTLLRKAAFPAVENSTFANVAISLRMDNCPDLFSLSGIQSYFDVIKLTSSIKSGTIDIFENNCNINFFAYSIGALLTETLLMSNPLQLFSCSKAFFFCGGSTFDKINGSSRFIMDSKAFANLRNNVFKHTGAIKKDIDIPLQQIKIKKNGWKAFLAMSGIKKYIKYREIAFLQLINRIKAIGLKCDDVIPGNAIKETFGKDVNDTCFDVDIMDFPYKYSHEVPFPVNDKIENDTVTQMFNTVFNKASLFLSL
jgi:hypothetical protein